ncbi:MAG: glutamine--tRNA ligase/YqeY domain fusion protein [Proteobacteria bacterium]|nr:glutamine--tRNA ligase/YqeY domain fusion protein [Pseudomonadota bacterium]MDA1357786.1 glutamine--tRNA ligase/YqeY domain fusion protein [Pseudomonadota bacterium]
MNERAEVAGPEEIRDYIRDIIRDDLAAGRREIVVTRFPPEPNGYLHIGHAKSVCLNFGVAGEFGGRCHMRFDDTNPTKEEHEYIDAIQADVRWLGFEWGEHLYFASDNFERLYGWAEHLIAAGDAYIDDLSPDEIREHRGTLTEPGRNSPFRDRTPEESLDLFRRMRAGEFSEGTRVLRAKIDMASGNMNLRDPVLYRILHAAHPRTGNQWCIYPTYDFAHGQSDAIEGVTHSLCTLEFEDHRPLYAWLIAHLPVETVPLQYEFSRLNLTYTVLSKRRLIQLVQENYVRGWDDPRLPTLRGLRRRGVPPAAIRDFVSRLAISKSDGTVEMALLEHCIREHLNKVALRRLAVLKPLKVVIENWPEGQTEMLDAVNNPADETAGTRSIPFSGEIYIEQDDFMEEPPKKFFRLAPGREVRLRYAYFITCTEVIKDAAGEVVELRCTYDPASRGGNSPDGRKVKATLHWVSAVDAVSAEVRVYNHLFTREDPGADGDVLDDLNPDSLEILQDCRLEPALAEAAQGVAVQFERQGYFCLDADSTAEKPVFNRTASLRDEWARIQKQGA